MTYIIDFISTATNDQVALYLTSNSATVITNFSFYKNVYHVDCPSTPVQTDIVQSIIDDESNPIQLLDYPQLTISPHTDEDWWKTVVFVGADVNTATITCNRRGENAIVYIVDSGIKTDHTEFSETQIQDLYSFNNDFTDYNGHGTALASLIVGKTCGITSATIKSVKIFQNGVSTLQSDMLSAFNAIANDIQQNPGYLNIVNLSWGIPRNQYIEDKIRYLLDVGVYVVAAAGNSGLPLENITPACMPEVITVGAFSQDFTPCDFSNYTGPLDTTTSTVNYGAIDLWSPGEKIKIATLNGDYGTAAGTSLSAAIHSSVLAYDSFIIASTNNTVSSAVYSNVFYNFKVFNENSCVIRDLLYLTGQYSSSENFISSAHTSIDNDINYSVLTAPFFEIKQASGIEVATYFPTFAIDSVSFADPLPDGFVMDWPWMIGKITTDTDFTWQSLITVTYKNSTVRTIPATIVITGDTTIQSVRQGFDSTILAINLFKTVPGTTTYTIPSVGTGLFAVPPGTTTLTVEVFGGGGAGSPGLSTIPGNGGGGGGGGGYVKSSFPTPPTTYDTLFAYTVGIWGNKSATIPGAGGSGGASSVKNSGTAVPGNQPFFPGAAISMNAGGGGGGTAASPGSAGLGGAGGPITAPTFGGGNLTNTAGNGGTPGLASNQPGAGGAARVGTFYTGAGGGNGGSVGNTNATSGTTGAVVFNYA